MHSVKSSAIYKSWVEISRNALQTNLTSFRNLIGKKVSLMCVVKSNVYGHGLREVVGLLKRDKAVWG